MAVDKAQKEPKDCTDGIGREVQPLAGAIGRAIGLQQFHDTAIHNGKDKWEGTDSVLSAVSLPTDNGSQHGIHDHVGPFVRQWHVCRHFHAANGQKRECRHGQSDKNAEGKRFDKAHVHLAIHGGMALLEIRVNSGTKVRVNAEMSTLIWPEKV